MRLINPHMAPFGAGLKSGMQVCKVKCSFVNRKLNICKQDANVKYLDAFTVALTQERWYFMNEYSFSQKRRPVCPRQKSSSDRCVMI